MDLDFSAEQVMCRDTVARLCNGHSDNAAVPACDSGEAAGSTCTLAEALATENKLSKEVTQ